MHLHVVGIGLAGRVLMRCVHNQTKREKNESCSRKGMEGDNWAFICGKTKLELLRCVCLPKFYKPLVNPENLR